MASLPTELSISSPTWAAAGLGMSGLFVYMARLYSQVRSRATNRALPGVSIDIILFTHAPPCVDSVFIQHVVGRLRLDSRTGVLSVQTHSFFGTLDEPRVITVGSHTVGQGMVTIMQPSASMHMLLDTSNSELFEEDTLMKALKMAPHSRRGLSEDGDEERAPGSHPEAGGRDEPGTRLSAKQRRKRARRDRQQRRNR